MSWSRCLCLFTLVVTAGCGVDASSTDEGLEIGSTVQPVTWSGNTFGIHATKYYEGGWVDSIPCQMGTSDHFGNQLQASATERFRFDLWNKQYYWHDAGGDGGPYSLESVDLFFSVTHGGASDTNAYWSMWNYDYLTSTGVHAFSSLMRLGEDEGVGEGLSIFATYSCNTLRWNSDTVARWDSVFSGGLRIALGSHDKVHSESGRGNEWVGAQFAIRLHQNWSIKQAWLTGLSYSSADNDSAALATGTNCTDCLDRLDTMTWYNFKTKGRRGDGSLPGIQCYCMVRRTNG
jgi:hypothetical protein